MLTTDVFEADLRALMDRASASLSVDGELLHDVRRQVMVRARRRRLATTAVSAVAVAGAGAMTAGAWGHGSHRPQVVRVGQVEVTAPSGVTVESAAPAVSTAEPFGRAQFGPAGTVRVRLQRAAPHSMLGVPLERIDVNGHPGRLNENKADRLVQLDVELPSTNPDARHLVFMGHDVPRDVVIRMAREAVKRL